jgi:hypothetical protein
MSDETEHEPLPLYLVTHDGPLAVNDNEPIASRHAAIPEPGDWFETLIEATPHQAEAIAHIVNVLEITVALPGRFVGDDGTVIEVAPNGTWHRPTHVHDPQAPVN